MAAFIIAYVIILWITLSYIHELNQTDYHLWLMFNNSSEHKLTYEDFKKWKRNCL